MLSQVNAPQSLKWAIYTRVSTGSQTTENQKVKLLQYAVDNNISFELYDETESTRKTRPVKQSLLQKLRQNEYAGVIIYKLDRWARSSRELILEIQELTEKGIAFKSISDNIDFSTSVGRLHFQILAAFAEFERNLISERTKEGIARTKLQGTRLGRPKGSKDSKPRRKSGYIIKEAKKRQRSDELSGNYLSLESYIEKSSPK